MRIMPRQIDRWLLATLVLVSPAVLAEDVAPAPQGVQAQQQNAPAPFKQEEIDALLAPIALYPDPLLTQILMAATYPLEVVQAARWAEEQNKKKLKPEQIQVVIHPQSVIHSMVQYRDTSVVAQLGTPDMRVPIAYGLAWPDRVVSGAQALDFHQLADMSFEALDSRGHRQRFPGLSLAWEALRSAAGTTAVLNAANEVAVAAFLDTRIRFDQIHHVNVATLEAVTASKPESLDDLLALDALSRETAQRAISRLSN